MNIQAKKKVFSGVQPTGSLHLGNYIGALSVWVKEQDNFDGIYCVVDLHALTIPEAIEPKVFHEKNWETVAMYLACGIDPNKSTIFIQSQVREHTELAWILTCMTPMGWLERMTQFKSKSGKQETVGTGLFTYPVLQAADILLYDTEVVPVGEDQKQHIEITRDIAQRFNQMFGEVFVLPEAMIPKAGARIMGLDDPESKMSKSSAVKNAKHAIGVVDEPKKIIKAIKAAKTDSASEVSFEGDMSPGVKNLLTIHHVMTGWDEAQQRAHFEGKGYGFFKSEIADAVVERLSPIREEYTRLLDDRAHLKAIARMGAEKAGAQAEAKVKAVKDALKINF